MNEPAAPEVRGLSERKHRAILEAAAEVFLRSGYVGASVDEVAALAPSSKQTIYKHFGSKEGLFIAVVTSMTGDAGDLVHLDLPGLRADEVPSFLEEYAMRQLRVVLTPHLMQLRRLVIGEVSRFPDLARVLYERGPQRAIGMMTEMMTRFADQGSLAIADPAVAATHFNWLIMADPVNRAMLLGDAAIPDEAALRAHVAEAVRIFLSAYGNTVT